MFCKIILDVVGLLAPSHKGMGLIDWYLAKAVGTIKATPTITQFVSYPIILVLPKQ